MTSSPYFLTCVTMYKSYILEVCVKFRMSKTSGMQSHRLSEIWSLESAFWSEI
eukprot:TRINITY_DN14603_c0_g1_i1.p1 TRINITY_DN14603_c0_g1~~TRINITY_DN14603_c0_g1_i1.p1  ORF type:complete len:53 (+),score=4.62 TRINITY_DN14603_c0_g1_i1:273-431(+)